MLTWLGLTTFIAASIQDYKQQQVSLILLLPFYIATFIQAGTLIFFLVTAAVGIYYILRQHFNFKTGIGTADIILTIPTLLIFNTLDPLLVLIILYSFTVASIYLTDKETIAAVPTMTLGYITLILIQI